MSSRDDSHSLFFVAHCQFQVALDIKPVPFHDVPLELPMRRVFSIIAAWLLIIIQPVPALAWEFSMAGFYTYQYETYGQLGSRGFFGAYDIDAGGGGPAAAAPGDYASHNGWVGAQMGGMVTGSDAALSVIFLWADMRLNINNSLKVRGMYHVGSWADFFQDISSGQLVSIGYRSDTFPGLQRSFSPGYWSNLWLSAKIPWGTVILGKRPNGFGAGLLFDPLNRTSESISLLVPYGPLTFTGNLYAAHPHNTHYSSAATLSPYYNTADKSGQRSLHYGASVEYSEGNISLGVLGEHLRSHYGPEAAVFQLNRDALNTLDTSSLLGIVYGKYSNGRVFANAEMDLVNAINRKGPRTGNEPDPYTYVDHYRLGIEAGLYVGASKLSALYAWISGNDRRNGQLIDRQGRLTGWMADSYASTTFFRPYSLIMVYGYGLGTDINADTGDGAIQDASVYGLRLDRAIAANLNVFVSLFRADRVGNGYGWGYLRPDTTGVLPGQVLGEETNGPAIPDRDLGWEVDAGVDWELLEGLNFSFAGGFWRPGKWFNYACVDKAIAGWADPNTAAGWAVNPAREIDPIWAARISIQGDF